MRRTGQRCSAAQRASNKLAQGNALGIECLRQSGALEGRHLRPRRFDSAPSGLWLGLCSLTQGVALGWRIAAPLGRNHRTSDLRGMFALGLLVGLAFFTANRAAADDAFPAIPAETPTVELTLRPAAAPEPALKYRFVRDLSERTPGNAVPYYYRAIQLERELHRNEKPETVEKWNSWQEMKPSELPVADVRASLDTRKYVLQELRTALGRERSDWDLRIQDVPGRAAISFLLEEFQQARTLGRVLQLEARLAIAEGRHADAAASIRDGFQLAADIDRSMPILITNLIGLAIASAMRDCVTDLIAAEGSPNLY